MNNFDKALKIYSDGTTAPISPIGKKFTLQELQQAVGGLIEILPTIFKGISLVCHEEAKMVESWEYNKLATDFYEHGFSHTKHGDVIAGNAILVADRLLN